jgi:hypothetical protein
LPLLFRDEDPPSLLLPLQLAIGSSSDPEAVVFREEFETNPEVAEEHAAPDPLAPALPLPPAVVHDEEAVVFVDVVDFLLAERLTLVVRPLKQRDNSAAALFVKLTSADIPVPVEPVALFHAARKTTRKQARI